MRASRGLASLSMLAGFVVSLLTSTELIYLFRDKLHYQCSFLTMGESDPGSFSCTDGIGYLMVGIAVHGVSVLLMLAFALIVFGPETPKAQVRSVRVTGLAVVPVAFLIASTVYTVIQRPADARQDANYWVEPMLSVTIVLCLAIALIVTASMTHRRPLRVLATGGAVLVLVGAAVVQTGTLPSVAMSLGILAAGMLLWRGELVQ